MKRFIYSLSALFIVSCGQAPRPLDHYIAQFERETGHSAADVDVQVTRLAGNTIGICWASGLVQIDESYWNVATEEQRTILIWHELGHCVLGKSHLIGSLEDRCPLSLMNATAPDADCAGKHFSAYKEHFETSVRGVREAADESPTPVACGDHKIASAN